MSKSLRSLTKNERMSKSLVFFERIAHLLILGKKRKLYPALLLVDWATDLFVFASIRYNFALQYFKLAVTEFIKSCTPIGYLGQCL